MKTSVRKTIFLSIILILLLSAIVPLAALAAESAGAPAAEPALEEYSILYSYSSDLSRPGDPGYDTLHQPFYVFIDPPPQEAGWVKWFLDDTLVATETDPPFSTLIDPGHLAEGGYIEAQFPDELHISPVSLGFDYEEETGYKITYGYSTQPSEEPLDGAEVFDDFHVFIVPTSLPEEVFTVYFYVDGKFVDADGTRPFSTLIKTASLTGGPHHLSADAIYMGGESYIRVDADFTYVTESEITYGYSSDYSTTPLKGELVDDPFYVFFDPGLPPDTLSATFWIDDVDSTPVGHLDEAPWSTRYDPSSLSTGRHILFVRYTTTSSPHEHMLDTFFWYGHQLVGTKFAVYADAHTCLPEGPYGASCHGDHTGVWIDGEEHTWWRGTWRRMRLEAVGETIRGRNKAEFVVALGDAIEDLYIGLGHPVGYHMKYVSETFPAKPHYFVLGNHDIRSYGWADYKHGLFIDYAKSQFEHYAGSYGAGTFVPEMHRYATAPIDQWDQAWHLLMLHSGETTKSFDDGSCVRFSSDQKAWLEAYLSDPRVMSKSVVLFWHISPQDEVYKPSEKTKCDVDTSYVELLRKYAPKIRATITGHVHVAKSYVWDTTATATDPYGTIHENHSPDETVWHDWNPVELSKIMMITAPSTGLPDKRDDRKDYYLEVSLNNDGTLHIDNKGHIQWKALGLSEIPTADFESRYTQADACFEQDNDGDGWFNDDEIDCPTGTHMGTELDYDSDQETYTIEAELDNFGWVNDYIPGRYHTVSSADIGETALENFTIGQYYGECTNATRPISTLSPKPGGGAVAVVVAGPDGVARQIANAETSDYTDQTSGISVVTVDHNDSYAAAYLENVPEDYQVHLYVEFEPGLKGELFIEGLSCGVEPYSQLDLYEDEEFEEALALEVVDNKLEWLVQGYLPLVFHRPR